MNNGQIYIGSTSNLADRLRLHKTGKVFSTNKYLPVRLVYYECYLAEKDARLREKMLKRYGSTWSHLKKRILYSLRSQSFSRAGFTLVEILIATALFAALVVGIIGVMVDASRAFVKASQIQAALNNIRFSFDLFSRELRAGENFSRVSYCNSIGPGIEFTNLTPNQRRYYYLADTNADLQPDAIMRIAKSNPTPIDPLVDCPTARQFTGEEVIIDRLNFNAEGLITGWGDGQPWITIVIRVRASDPRLAQDTIMDLQTTVTPRVRDF